MVQAGGVTNRSTAKYPPTAVAGRGLHSSTSQLNLSRFLVTEATSSVHFSEQPETLLSITLPNIAHKNYSRQADTGRLQSRKRAHNELRSGRV